MKNDRNLRRTLYTLKKGFSVPVTVSRTVAGTIDYETGVETSTTTTYTIKRAIKLTTNSLRDFIYSEGMPENYKYGNYIDASLTVFIIDNRDIAITIDVNTDTILYSGLIYNIQDAFIIEGDSTLLVTKALK